MDRHLIASLAVALALGGCASPAPVPPAEIRAVSTETWAVHGRVGIRTAEQSLSGKFQWQHRAQTDELLMTSPLGQGVALIVRDPHGVTLEVPNQPPRRAADAESLTREVLGYSLPVSGLAWWMQARPDPDREYEGKRDASGRYAQIRQDGWVIDYLQYTDERSPRPRKIVVARDGLEIRLVADEWRNE